MEYMPVSETAKIWGISERRVQKLCEAPPYGRKPTMNEYKIMIVDDEPDILELLEKSLTIEGFHDIIKIDNGLSAVSSCKELQPDVMILDVMLPDIDGYEVCKRIRAFSHCPILFLSSKNDELDKILGLAVGGDDYVTKPFSPKEVAFRVKAQLRRAEYKQLPTKAQTLKVGALRIDPEGCRVVKEGAEIELKYKPFVHTAAILVVLFAFAYAFWLSRKLSTMIGGIRNIAADNYQPLEETGVFAEIYGSLNKMDIEIRHSEKIQQEIDRTHLHFCKLFSLTWA